MIGLTFLRITNLTRGLMEASKGLHAFSHNGQEALINQLV